MMVGASSSRSNQLRLQLGEVPMIFGYARVSTVEQDAQLQLDALRKAGAQIIFQEKRSGADRNRPELAKLLDQIGPGDTLIVYKIDRLARSLTHLFRVIERLTEAGASLKSLTEPIGMDTAAGRAMLGMLGVFAELERDLIRERTIAGQVAAIKRGVKIGGRDKKLPDHVHERMKKDRQNGLTWAELGRKYGVSNTTARRYVLGDDRDRMKVLKQYILDV